MAFRAACDIDGGISQHQHSVRQKIEDLGEVDGSASIRVDDFQLFGGELVLVLTLPVFLVSGEEFLNTFLNGSLRKLHRTTDNLSDLTLR